jgi:hypothetical protein
MQYNHPILGGTPLSNTYHLGFIVGLAEEVLSSRYEWLAMSIYGEIIIFIIPGYFW